MYAALSCVGLYEAGNRELLNPGLSRTLGVEWFGT
jgi:hypothetical protein